MIFVRDDIPSKEIKVNILHFDIECLFREFNIRKAKWLVVGCYHPPPQNDDCYFYNLNKVLSSLNTNSENFYELWILTQKIMKLKFLVF